jgi:SAM-dependent methyltransferase
VVDLPADLFDLARRPALPLPPASLRCRVAGGSRRREFLEVGARIARDLRGAYERAGGSTAGGAAWLDFGCGAGRVARHVAAFPIVTELVGVDIDVEAIDWARRNLPGRYEPIPRLPPTDLAESTFDAAYAVSVFSHLDAEAESAWLAELHRILKPGGFLLATTNSPSLSWGRPDMSADQREKLRRDGAVFLRGGGEDFNEDTAYLSNDRLRRVWGRLFGQLLFLEHGAAGYQDLSAWVKW